MCRWERSPKNVVSASKSLPNNNHPQLGSLTSTVPLAYTYTLLKVPAEVPPAADGGHDMAAAAAFEQSEVKEGCRLFIAQLAWATTVRNGLPMSR